MKEKFKTNEKQARNLQTKTLKNQSHLKMNYTLYTKRTIEMKRFKLDAYGTGEGFFCKQHVHTYTYAVANQL